MAGIAPELQRVPATDWDDEITALSLQLDEIGLFRDRTSGERPVAQSEDTHAVLEAFQEDVARHLTILNDTKLAHNLPRGVSPEVGRLHTDLTSTQSRSGSAEQAGEIPAVDDDLPPSTSHDIQGVDDKEPGNDTTPEEHCQCVVCMDDVAVSRSVHLQCGDIYCKECLKSSFLRATKDETLHPARCCKLPIPIHHIEEELTTEELETIRLASIEFSTVNRTYCSNPQCSSFILPEHMSGNIATCAGCKLQTCAFCKSAAHDGECPDDPDIEATLVLGMATMFGLPGPGGSWIRLLSYHVCYATINFPLRRSVLTLSRAQVSMPSRILLSVRREMEDLPMPPVG